MRIDGISRFRHMAHLAFHDHVFSPQVSNLRRRVLKALRVLTYGSEVYGWDLTERAHSDSQKGTRSTL